MTEHKTTTGPTTPGNRAADWFLESGFSTEFQHTPGAIHMEVPHLFQDLTPESAAALRDALTAHLENIGHETGPRSIGHPDRTLAWDGIIVSRGLRDSRGKRLADPVVSASPVAQDVADAYAENARTIGAADTVDITDAEAAQIMDGIQLGEPDGTGPWTDTMGVRYTSAAYRELAVKARRHPGAGPWPTPAQLARLEADIQSAGEEAALKSPVAREGSRQIMVSVVRSWSDDQCRGAWNHAMEAHRSDRLTDRPSGRAYTLLASRLLRDRLNQINAAPRD